MTIKELIEQLSKFDPNTEVLGSCTDPTDFIYKVPIQSIKFDDPFDSNGYSGIDGTEIWDVEAEDKVVIINLGNV